MDKKDKPTKTDAIAYLMNLENHTIETDSEAGVSLLYDIVMRVEGKKVTSKREGGFVDQLTSAPLEKRIPLDGVKRYSSAILDGDISDYVSFPNTEREDLDSEQEKKEKEKELVTM